MRIPSIFFSFILLIVGISSHLNAQTKKEPIKIEPPARFGTTPANYLVRYIDTRDLCNSPYGFSSQSIMVSLWKWMNQGKVKTFVPASDGLIEYKPPLRNTFDYWSYSEELIDSTTYSYLVLVWKVSLDSCEIGEEAEPYLVGISSGYQYEPYADLYWSDPSQTQISAVFLTPYEQVKPLLTTAALKWENPYYMHELPIQEALQKEKYLIESSTVFAWNEPYWLIENYSEGVYDKSGLGKSSCLSDREKALQTGQSYGRFQQPMSALRKVWLNRSTSSIATGTNDVFKLSGMINPYISMMRQLGKMIETDTNLVLFDLNTKPGRLVQVTWKEISKDHVRWNPGSNFINDDYEVREEYDFQYSLNYDALFIVERSELTLHQGDYADDPKWVDVYQLWDGAYYDQVQRSIYIGSLEYTKYAELVNSFSQINWYHPDNHADSMRIDHLILSDRVPSLDHSLYSGHQSIYGFPMENKEVASFGIGPDYSFGNQYRSMAYTLIKDTFLFKEVVDKHLKYDFLRAADTAGAMRSIPVRGLPTYFRFSVDYTRGELDQANIDTLANFWLTQVLSQKIQGFEVFPSIKANPTNINQYLNAKAFPYDEYSMQPIDTQMIQYDRSELSFIVRYLRSYSNGKYGKWQPYSITLIQNPDCCFQYNSNLVTVSYNDAVNSIKDKKAKKAFMKAWNVPGNRTLQGIYDPTGLYVLVGVEPGMPLSEWPKETQDRFRLLLETK
jgi:hypothetical protein